MRQGIKEKDIRDFEKYAEKLAAVLRRIQEYKPEACGYLSEDTMHLLSGPSHDIYTWNDAKLRENVVAEVDMIGFDGGGW